MLFVTSTPPLKRVCVQLGASVACSSAHTPPSTPHACWSFCFTHTYLVHQVEVPQWDALVLHPLLIRADVSLHLRLRRQARPTRQQPADINKGCNRQQSEQSGTSTEQPCEAVIISTSSPTVQSCPTQLPVAKLHSPTTMPAFAVHVHVCSVSAQLC